METAVVTLAMVVLLTGPYLAAVCTFGEWRYHRDPLRQEFWKGVFVSQAAGLLGGWYTFFTNSLLPGPAWVWTVALAYAGSVLMVWLPWSLILFSTAMITCRRR